MLQATLLVTSFSDEVIRVYLNHRMTYFMSLRRSPVLAMASHFLLAILRVNS